MTDETATPTGPEPEPPVPGWPKESGERLAKIKALEALGESAYPTKFNRSHSLAPVVAEWGSLTGEELTAKGIEVSVAGRVLARRPFGKAGFATLSDGDGTLQAYVRADAVDARSYEIWNLVDVGDFIGVTGKLMRTRTGELSVQAATITLLSKALLPLPEKWHGLTDVETRYRQRYVDMVANPEVRKTFVARSKMVASIRRFMDERDYVEVETPMMHPIAGGALARPFVTHHNALGVDLFLRIAPELYLKRLGVGGLERVYEINRNFRNEGLSTHHNPEFTMLEFYTAYFDCRDVMALTEQLIENAAITATGRTDVTWGETALSFKTPFARIRMSQAIATALTPALGTTVTVADVEDAEKLKAIVTTDAFVKACRKHGVAPADYKKRSHGKTIEALFGDFAEKGLIQPTYVVDYPVEISPLAKRRADNPDFADRFELFCCGMEIANGFSELNDPLEQRARFLEQIGSREGGDDEAHQMDEDYVRALGHGLPPTGGCGLGIDRLAMLLTNSKSIRDVILFPQMRPEGGRKTDA
ncbi:MAG: lysine--tRNA ligase [Vicinamibacteria bacterium]